MRSPLPAALLAFGPLACGAPPPSGPASSAPPVASGPVPIASTPASSSANGPAPGPHKPIFGPLDGVYLGGAHLCVAETNGSVRCLGDWPIPFRENGVRNQGFRSPVTVENLSRPRTIALGTNRGCAIIADGSVWCWGNTVPSAFNWTGAQEGKLVAVPVDGVRDAVELAFGWSGSCALDKSGKVTCWGPGFAPAFGKDKTVPPPRPLKLDRVTHITAQGKHGCASLEDGTVACWGDDTMADAQKRAPGEERVKRIAGVKDAVNVTAGDAHDCALTKAGEVLCWGANGSGQLGDGTFEARTTPVKVTGLAEVAEIIAGHGFNCARTSAGAVSCWGDAGSCVLGDAPKGCTKRTMNGTMGSFDLTFCPTPQPIPLPFTPVSIAVGSGTACARDAQGNVACWGRSLTENPGGCQARPL